MRLSSSMFRGLTPLLLLAPSLGADYHLMILIAVGLCGVAGTAGLTLFFRGANPDRELRKAKHPAVGPFGGWSLRMAVLVVFESLRRAGNYALSRPARETLGRARRVAGCGNTP